MKVCIFGAGAIGAHIGVLMKLAGVDVSLVARGAHLEAIRQNGLKLVINGGEKVARMPATNNPAELGAGLRHHRVEGASGLGNGRADEPLLGPNTGRGDGAKRHSVVVLLRLPGQYANLQLESVDPRDRQWHAIESGARHRLHGLSGGRDRVARRDEACSTGTHIGLGEPIAWRPSGMKRARARIRGRRTEGEGSIRRSATTSG